MNLLNAEIYSQLEMCSASSSRRSSTMKWSIQRGESKNKVKEAAGVKVGKRKAGL